MDPGAGPGVVAGPPDASSVLGGSLLCNLESLQDLACWRDEVINLHRQGILDGSAVPDVARPVEISTLEALLAAGIRRMRENGELAVDSDPARLATGLTAALWGGSLLARTTRDISPLESALDFALTYVRSHSSR